MKCTSGAEVHEKTDANIAYTNYFVGSTAYPASGLILVHCGSSELSEMERITAMHFLLHPIASKCFS